MKTMKTWKTFVFAVLAVLLFASCGKKEKKDSELFRYVGLKVYDPVYVAKDKGFFKDEGLDVEIVDTVAGGATAVQMVSSGNVNGGLLFTGAVANAVNSGLPVIGVADVQSAFIGTPLEEFYVRKDGEIKSVKDLKGKKIAINLIKASFHYTWLMMLEKEGLSESDVTFVLLPFDQQQGALERGQVDAIGLMQPYTKSARESGLLERLYTATDAFGEKQFTLTIINSVWAENNPETAGKFVAGIAKATEWIKDNQQEAKEIISKYTGVNPEYIDDYRFQEHARVVEGDAEYWLGYMKRVEGVRKDITADMVATNKYGTRVK